MTSSPPPKTEPKTEDDSTWWDRVESHHKAWGLIVALIGIGVAGALGFKSIAQVDYVDQQFSTAREEATELAEENRGLIVAAGEERTQGFRDLHQEIERVNEDVIDTSAKVEMILLMMQRDDTRRSSERERIDQRIRELRAGARPASARELEPL